VLCKSRRFFSRSLASFSNFSPGMAGVLSRRRALPLFGLRRTEDILLYLGGYTVIVSTPFYTEEKLAKRLA